MLSIRRKTPEAIFSKKVAVVNRKKNQFSKNSQFLEKDQEIHLFISNFYNLRIKKQKCENLSAKMKIVFYAVLRSCQVTNRIFI